jgi:hypothetical protein
LTGRMPPCHARVVEFDYRMRMVVHRASSSRRTVSDSTFPSPGWPGNHVRHARLARRERNQRSRDARHLDGEPARRSAASRRSSSDRLLSVVHSTARFSGSGLLQLRAVLGHLVASAYSTTGVCHSGESRNSFSDACPFHVVPPVAQCTPHWNNHSQSASFSQWRFWRPCIVAEHSRQAAYAHY